MITIERLTSARLQAVQSELIRLLDDAVASGASVGFMPPLAPSEALHYWQSVSADLEREARALLVARDDEGIVGTVQLALPLQPNARHRAEVQKLLVHTRARRKGVGQALMAAIEALAVQEGRNLLVLDTRQGDDAERLYRRLGYIEAGAIPLYAQSADGSLHTTIFFYRQLGS
ncbi:MAG TPA: GNAT family N-acetyltransferase [Herpetosiphonaceae bacterium]